MALTKEHIKKIDNFLLGIGIEYNDIRFEMVDHIATDIELKVNNLDAFFKYNRLETVFLRYMLSKRQQLLKDYHKQIRKRSLMDQVFIFKSAIENIFNFKAILLIITAFLLFKFSMNYSLKLTGILSLISMLAFLFFSAHLFNKERKRLGELKILYSYSINLSILGWITFQIVYSDLFSVFPDLNFHYPYIYFIYMVLQISILSSFLKNQSSFRKKYQYLIGS